MGLIQKLVLFLGHPTYALTVVVFSMLVSSGTGSFCSRRLIRWDDGRLMTALSAVAGVVAVLVLITIVLIAAAGFVMGEWHPPSVRWAWPLNAAALVGGVLFLAGVSYA